MSSRTKPRITWQRVAKVRATRRQSVARVGTAPAIVEQVDQQWGVQVQIGHARDVSPRFAFRIEAMAWAEERLVVLGSEA